MKVPAIGPDSPDDPHYRPPTTFPIGPFTRYKHNPVLRADPSLGEAYLYNAAAIVVDDKVFLLLRSQTRERTLSIGLAWLHDGLEFHRYKRPVLEPTEPWEAGGGCEDPRVVRDPKTKRFIMTYTAYDRLTARLCVAELLDLVHWKKHPPFVPADWTDIAIAEDGSQYLRRAWLKSGAVFVDRQRDGRYYMVWGEGALHLATSDDLVHWHVEDYRGLLFATGNFAWQSRLLEPGPPPIRLATGDERNLYILFYNSAALGDAVWPRGSYAISQMLVDYDRLHAGPLARMEHPDLVPEQPNEVTGQVDRVVFTEGVVQFRGRWFMYFGQGDSDLGVAIAPGPPKTH